MLEKLKHNLVMKIMSVIIAVLFWFVVYTNDNPIEIRQLDIPLTVINENYLLADNLRILNEYPRKTSITIKGRKSELDEVSENDFMAYLDFSDIKDENTEYIEIIEFSYIGEKNINYELSGSGRVGVSVDRIIAAEVPITVEMTGEPAENYIVTGTTVKPASYAILEIKTLVQEMESVVVSIDVTGIKGTQTVRKFCKVYDRYGNIINELSNTTAIDITINVAKEVPVEIKIEGSPAEDYIETSVVANPAYVYITGEESDLEDLEKIYTLSVSIAGADKSFKVVTQLQNLPSGTGFVGSGEVEVFVAIEPLYEKVFTFYPEDIIRRYGAPANVRIYEILSNGTEIRLKARQSILNELVKNDITAYVDVSGQSDGYISLALRIEVPSFTTQVTFPLVDFLIQTKKSIQISTDDIVIDNRKGGLYDYSFVNPSEMLVVKGFSDNIDLLNPMNLNPQIDAGELEVGVHEVPVTIYLPDGVELDGTFTTQLKVTEK